MWPLSNITSSQNSNAIHGSIYVTKHHHPYQQQHQKKCGDVVSNPLFCQVVSCVDHYNSKNQYRSQSPSTIKRNIHYFYNPARSTASSSSSFVDEVELIYSYKSPKLNNNTASKKLKSATTSYKSPSSLLISSPYGSPNTIRRKDVTGPTYPTPGTTTPKKSKNKNVTFSLVEVREHPRILGDNPSAKKGPPLSIGWYEPEVGRILRYSVDEYERRREPHRITKKSMDIVSPTERQRMLLQDVGVTPSEIFAARKEVSKIRKSRRDHNILVSYDDTAVVLEHCISTVQRILYNGTSSESELKALMEQAERSKRQQQHQQRSIRVIRKDSQQLVHPTTEKALANE